MIDKDVSRKRAVADLKGLQDVLGRFQDSEVQRQSLRGFAEEMMADGAPAEAMLAMGELIGHLDAEQDRAAARVRRRVRRFDAGQRVSGGCARSEAGGEGLRDVQHQGWRREDVDRREPRLPRCPRGQADACCGTSTRRLRRRSCSGCDRGSRAVVTLS